MKKRLISGGIRLAIVFLLAATFSFVREDSTAYSVALWDDTSYFNAVNACDSNFNDTRDDCRAQPNYPTSPDESRCRHNAWEAYTQCISDIDEPTYELDFCDMARTARDNCHMQYGPAGANPDFDTWMTCWAASGIHLCE